MSGKHGSISVFLAAIAWVFLVSTQDICDAAVPQVINYQGYLTDTDGNPVPDDTYTMTFFLYTTESGGSAEWSEGQEVPGDR